jgi:hypothetical protein
VVTGGAGGGAVYGPTAVGSANANPPVVIGGTATGVAGQNVVGAAVKAASTAPLATDTALVVSISPNSVNANGQATMANSAPVVIASNQSAVSVTETNFPASVSVGTGAQGASSPRVTVAIDTATIAGSAPGPAADTASVPSVLSPTSSSTAAMGHASTTALGTSLVGKASAGNLYGFNCTGIAGGAPGYCIVYNGTTAPATGALTGANVLDFCYFNSTPGGCSLSRHPLAVNYSVGIVVLISTAASPYTYTTGTDTGAITVDYK